jgi:hypothetical protein
MATYHRIGGSFEERVGGVFSRLLDVLEKKYLITKRERDYIIGDMTKEQWLEGEQNEH